MKRYLISILFLVLAITSAFFISKVKVNYDLETYLPKNSEIKAGIDAYYSEFGDSSTVTFSFDETDIATALLVKQEIMQVDNIEMIDYIDQYFNPVTYGIIYTNLTDQQKIMMDSYLNSLLQSGMSYPEAFIALIQYLPSDYQKEFNGILSHYVSDESMLMRVVFSTNSSSSETEAQIDQIKTILSDNGYTYHFSGSAESSIYTKNTIEKEVGLITLICIPLILLLLFVLSKSFFDIVIFAIVIGVSIVINLGTNAFLPSISFITSSMAIVLQIAISLDYVIFLINAYHRERALGKRVDLALANAKKKSKKPIIASALTTGVSFLALVVMRFTIGVDIGIVFAKAILISLLATIFLLPEMIRLFSKMLDKTTKPIKTIFSGKITGKLNKFKYGFSVLLFIILGVSLYFQTQNQYTYGSSSFAGTEGTSYYDDKKYIEDKFGQTNTMIILLPKNDVDELALYQELTQLDYVENIQAGIYYKSVVTDPNTLNLITNNLYSDNNALIKFYLKSDSEGKQAFQYYDNINTIIKDLNIQNAYILGETSIAYHIKETVSVDYTLVLILAALAIMIVVFIAFRNLFMPVLLIFIIITSVFFTMTILQFISGTMVFLANLVVSAILLGVTIDYAILLSRSYMEFRKTLSIKESTIKAIQNSAPSIITSAMLFSISGLTIAVISSIETIAQIGLIIAVGAITSLLFVLIILPQMLTIFDKLITKSKI